MSVGKICSRVIDTADAEELVADVAERMRESNVGSLPVVDEQGRLIGIVTDRDLALRVLAERRDGRLTRVAEIMSECLQTVRDDASIEVAMSAMRQQRTRRLPVLDDADKLVGILTIDDILALLAEEFGAIGSVIEAESPRKLTPGIPEEPPPDAAPRQRRTTLPHRSPDLSAVEHTLVEIRESLEVIACALSIGLETRMLGGGVIEAEVRAAADRRLHNVLARNGPESQAMANPRNRKET